MVLLPLRLRVQLAEQSSSRPIERMMSPMTDSPHLQWSQHVAGNLSPGKIDARAGENLLCLPPTPTTVACGPLSSLMGHLRLPRRERNLGSGGPDVFKNGIPEHGKPSLRISQSKECCIITCGQSAPLTNRAADNSPMWTNDSWLLCALNLVHSSCAGVVCWDLREVLAWPSLSSKRVRQSP